MLVGRPVSAGSTSGKQPPVEAAMIALALMKAEVPHTDPAVQACLSQVRRRFHRRRLHPRDGRRRRHVRGGRVGDGAGHRRCRREPRL